MKRRYTDVEPGGNGTFMDDGRYQHTPVEAGSAGQEVLEVVDGREAGLGIVEGKRLSVPGAPAAMRTQRSFMTAFPFKPGHQLLD